MTNRLPLRALLPLATAAFITVLTEALPAGVLPAMSADLEITESATGQLVTIYAVGTAVAAIPLSAAMATWRRRRLLLVGVAGFAVANTVTAVSVSFPATLVARFVAGTAAGLVWALLAGYARRLAPGPVRGRAIAIVMAGIPLALALGVPAGTFVGAVLGWQVTFAAISVLAIVLLAWIATAVPDLPGALRGSRIPVLRTAARPGVAPVLVVTFAVVLANTILYTYIATFLERLGMGASTDLVLLVLGIASVAGIGIVGARIDLLLRPLMIGGAVLFAAAATALAALDGNRLLVVAAVAVWGLGFGGIPTLLQTAVGAVGGDTGQAMLVTLWNAAMAAGGVTGGMLLDGLGPGSFPWAVLGLLVPALAVVVGARAHGFPSRTAVATAA
ncbi:MFS transporter [Pseudonocardia sp. GCM10023141]|uniref:MFS transporter n=1 Tax=Pseudonocardia sp. GCM10023141 TaxID=3252653 RepID=UPI0036167A29